MSDPVVQLFVQVTACVVLVAFGLALVGVGQMFDALREIALNTRAAARVTDPTFQADGSSYSGLRLISVALRATGIWIAVSSVLAGGYLIVQAIRG